MASEFIRDVRIAKTENDLPSQLQEFLSTVRATGVEPWDKLEWGYSADGTPKFVDVSEWYVPRE
jgi:hypothetical protein